MTRLENLLKRIMSSALKNGDTRTCNLARIALLELRKEHRRRSRDNNKLTIFN